MKSNTFKESLKAIIDSITVEEQHNTDELLKKLHLYNLPENIQASISEDNQYLNIKLKDSPNEKHLLFQFNLKENDLSALRQRDDYQDLINRYQLYINDYMNEIKEYAALESKCLHQEFPGLVFSIKLRIKSFDSYINKLNDNILKGKNPYINDIAAERIIVSQYNNSQDEDMLKNMCDKVAKTLYDFRIHTNFRMQESVDQNNSISDKEYITKDYIDKPKDNGYESLHILMQDKYNSDFTYETQIRTLEMEEMSKTSGEIAHTKYKPRLLNDLSPNRVPLYSEVSCFTDENGNPIIYDAPLENRFYHFYNSDSVDHSNLKERPNPITYKKFRKEQHQIESLLGIEFKDIRQRIKIINKERKSLYR